MSKQEFIKTQTCVLRVNVQCDCEGCRSKVKKLLLKVDGVYTVSIDPKQGKVTVAGNVDPALLIRKLEKSGKHAELWNQKNSHLKNTQFHSLDSNSAHKNTNKNHQKGNINGNSNGNDHHHQQRNAHIEQLLQQQIQHQRQQQLQQQQLQQQRQQQQMKGSKEQKSVKFNLPTHGHDPNVDGGSDTEDDDFDDDDFDDEDEDAFDDESDHGEDHDDHEEFDNVSGHPGHAHTKTIRIPVIANNATHKNKGQQNKKRGLKDKNSGGGRGSGSGSGGKVKKGGGFHLPTMLKSIASNAGCKRINVDKKGTNVVGRGGKGGDPSHSGVKGGRQAKNGGGGSVGGSVGGSGGGGSGGGNNKNGGGNNKKGQKGKKKDGDGPKGQGLQNMNILPQNVNGNMGQVGPMGQVGQVGSYPMGPNGLPAAGTMNGRYYNQGMMGPSGPFGNPYVNQQQYIAMLMNQQRINGEAMHPQQMMYGRPPPVAGAGYMPLPPSGYDPLTHIFSDENTASCSIM